MWIWMEIWKLIMDASVDSHIDAFLWIHKSDFQGVFEFEEAVHSFHQFFAPHPSTSCFGLRSEHDSAT